CVPNPIFETSGFDLRAVALTNLISAIKICLLKNLLRRNYTARRKNFEVLPKKFLLVKKI
ncbi:MAG: hypothetical protein IJS69_01230, partial [Selenomonadaceae bacterium]|nr:hypothetical protein [Selenomonadaceae bacterium]